MIYNGLYSSGTTANSCANATTNAEIADKRFGLQGNSAESTNWHYNINRVGYTFNNDNLVYSEIPELDVGYTSRYINIPLMLNFYHVDCLLDRDIVHIDNVNL